MDDATPHQSIPETIDDGSGESPVFRMRHQRGQLSKSFFAGGCGIDLADFRKQPCGLRFASEWFVAAMDFRRRRGIDRRKSPGFIQFPAINETVMARSAFQIDPEERLRDALRKLDFHGLSGTDFSAPANSIDVALAGRSWWCNQFPGELIKGFILQQCLIEPPTDLLSTTCDEPCSTVVVTQQIIEERQPVIGVGNVVSQQLTNHSVSFVGRWVANESVQCFGFGK